MNLRELEYIVTLAEEKSLTRAAKKLFVTPSALTQQVLRLEKELETPLFLRSRNGWQPTQAGDIYLESARQILLCKENTYHKIRDLKEQQSFTLSIGMPPERGSDLFSAVFPKFREKHPEVTIRLRETDVQTQQALIADGHLDLAFVTLTNDQKTADNYISLRKEEILVAVPGDYPESLLDSTKHSPYPILSLEKLKNEPFAMMSRSSTLREVQEEIFRKNDFAPTVNLETSRSKTIFEMVSGHLCCALVCEYAAKSQPLRNVKLYSLPDHPSWELMVCFRKGKYLTKAEQYFISLVRDCT